MSVKLDISPVKRSYQIGDRLELVATIKNTEGVAADPVTITFRERTPSGYIGNVANSKITVGTYTAPIVLNSSGIWHFRVDCTGDNGGADEVGIQVSASVFPVI